MHPTMRRQKLQLPTLPMRGPHPMTSLTPAQTAIIDKLERDDPDARIIGWNPHHHGPLIIRSSGKWQVLTERGRLIRA